MVVVCIKYLHPDLHTVMYVWHMNTNTLHMQSVLVLYCLLQAGYLLSYCNTLCNCLAIGSSTYVLD